MSATLRGALMSVEDRVTGWLRFYFALLSCLGGVVLGTSAETEALPLIAVFFAAFGFVFVDTLKLFALPSPIAYGAMGLSAAYCVLNFTNTEGAGGNAQIVAVAELLVMVQAVLMLQKKNRRIFEQLGVFCLLQLVVSAVFSDAIHYGLLLIPIGMVGLLALGALAVLMAVQPADPRKPAGPTISPRRARSVGGAWRGANVVGTAGTDPGIECAAVRDPLDAGRIGAATSWVGLLGVVPAVTLIALVFFYALPRTMEAPAAGRAGNVVVGFNEQVRLEQFGEMLQRSDVAVRVQLTDRDTAARYPVVGEMYLRGKVLERYASKVVGGRPTAQWNSIPSGRIRRSLRAPREFRPSRQTDRNFYDSVVATITCEPMRSPSLFSIVPYHSVGATREWVHEADRWTIRRQQAELEGLHWNFPRLKYELGTHGFRDGIQSDLTSRLATAASESGRFDAGTSRASGRRRDRYVRELSLIDRDAFPALIEKTETLVEEMQLSEPNDFEVARSLERWLKFDGGFRYSLNLDSPPIPGMDPIEQFLAIDRRGHCQYFASALAMMLRSRDIPARLVVGYRTDEYSELARVYVARQYHAHAWVEALIDRDQLPEGAIVYGQPVSEQYWLRLDPTPAGGPGSEFDPGRVGGVRQMFDFAQNLWDDYVVEMDRDSQRDSLLNAPGMAPMSESYGEMIASVRRFAERLREGRAAGRWLAGRELFSWPAAIAAVTITLVVMALFRIRIYRWIRRRVTGEREAAAATPSLPFYAEALNEVARLGIVRRRGETPAEFTRDASETVARRHHVSLADPLHRLTTAYYRIRFGVARRRIGGEAELSASDRGALDELKRRVRGIAEGDSVGEGRS